MCMHKSEIHGILDTDKALSIGKGSGLEGGSAKEIHFNPDFWKFEVWTCFCPWTTIADFSICLNDSNYEGGVFLVNFAILHSEWSPLCWFVIMHIKGIRSRKK